MKNFHLILIVWISVSISSAATLIVGLSDSTSSTIYDSNISSSDLVNAGESTLDSVVASSATGSFTEAGVNNGIPADSSANATFYKNSNLSATVTFTLDITENFLGYDLTSIQTFAGWHVNSTTHANQDYDVYLSYVGDSAFSLFEEVNYTPFITGNGAKSSMVTISDDAGESIATGVDEIRFIYHETGTWGTSAGVLIRELDVQGFATVPEPCSSVLVALGSVALTLRRRRR